MPTRNRRFHSHGAAQRGFTAIEIAMVATVIAIFALIVLPIFRNRVEEAKLAAARADLVSMMKALTLEQADTGAFVRLEDLDNTSFNLPTTPPAIGITIETPIFTYPTNHDVYQRRSLDDDGWRKFAGSKTTPKWKGPYISFQNYIGYDEALNNTSMIPIMRSRATSDNLDRPIQDIPQSGGNGGPPTDAQLFDSQDPANPNRIPVDPWGTPYLFYPPDNGSFQRTETGYGESWLVSLGPDGFPGDLLTNPTNDQRAYLRNYVDGSGIHPLGTGDDIVVRF
ncbi:MAG: prepilin-type N-terminal cleavage/methylation domain-containing protein [Candidatus Sumerlaeaceae bacterium]